MANLATITNNILADSGIDPIDLIVGTGTINYIPKFTSEGSIGNSIMTESGANILISGNIVLNAGNYNNYAPTLTGGGASGTWGINITGNAGTSTQANAAYLVNGTSGGAIQSWDIRTISPSSMSSYRMGFGFTSWDNNNTSPYADYLHLRSYSDGSGGSDNLIMFLKSGIGMRIYQQTFNSSTPYSSYVDVLHSSNYTNYAVQTTTQSNWNNYNVIANVIGLLAWKNYGNNHVIFDASKSTSPSGTAISSTDSQSAWAPTYPTLMGWNGTNTYGVRVDSARLADNADTVDGYHATNAAGGLAYYAANGYLYAPAWINVDNGGIFSGTNSAHFRPNPNTYGPWLISGSRNNYSGLEFDTLVNGNVSLSISTTSNITGFYNTSYGWQFFWNGGTMYVYKNTYGGGAQATVLDSSNFNTWAAAVNGNTANSFNVFQLSYAATTFNPSAAPRSQMNPMSIKMWNNYFNGTGLGVDYGTVMQYYSLGDHVDTQVYFDAGGGSWYRSSAYGQGWQSWQKYVTENSGTWSISVSGSSAYAPLLSASGSLLTQFGSGRIGYVYGIYYLEAGLFPASDNSNAIITVNRHPGDYYSQLGFSSNGEIYYRRFSATAINTTLPWVTLLTSNNYNSYAPTLTGGGASGTWNISITGSAGNVSFNSLIDKTGGTGTYQTSGDFRAPVFYDSDNTNYYVDPNGLSRMYRLQIIGDWAGANPNEGAINIRGAYPSMTFRNTVSNNMWLRHMDGSGNIQHYFAPNGVDSSDWSIKHSMLNDGTFTSQGSMRAPIFYDINDTNYYLDPNSTSNLYYVIGLNFRVGNAIYFGGGNNYFNWDGRINSNVGIQSQSDMRAPIFYDINDTNYYVDPNGLSVLRSVQIGAYNQYSITLPTPSNNYGNGRIYIRIQPVGGRIVSFKISISSTWNWAPAFGFISADVSYYCDGTNLVYPQVAITSATGQALVDLTIGNLVIENGYISLPIYSVNTNTIFVKFEGAPSFDWNLITTSGWESVGFPGSAVVNIPGALTTGGNITMSGNLVATQSWVNSQGFVTGGPYLPLSGGTLSGALTVNAYIYSNQWIQLNNYTGLYSPNNNAHFRPNPGSYGPWLITGSRNGWSGIEFESLSNGNVTMMIGGDSNTSGWHNSSYGWQFNWSNGTAYVYKNSYGGGTPYAVLDAANFSSYAVAAYGTSSGDIDGDWGQSFKTFDPIPSGTPPIQSPNIRTINVGNSYARKTQIAFNYESTRSWFRRRTEAGWDSWAEYIHSLNYNNYSPTLTGTGASGTWGISITGNADTVDGYHESAFMRYYGFSTSGNFQTFQAIPGRLRFDQVGDIGSGAWSNAPTGIYTYGGVLSYRGDSFGLQIYASHTGGMVYKTQWNDDQYSGWLRILDAQNYNSYSPTLTGGNASGTWGINITGNANYASTSNYANSSGTAQGLSIVGYGSSTQTFYQTPGTFAGYSGWASYLVSSHGDGATYYNQTIIMPFWGPPQYSRLEGGVFRGPYIFVTTENSPYAYNMNQYVRTTDSPTFFGTLSISADNSVNYTGSRIWLYSHSSYRGSGVYMSLNGGSSTWYAGSPYTNFSGYYMIGYVAATGSDAAADPSNRKWQVSPSGDTQQPGAVYANNFIDYDNNAYYLNLNSGGYLRGRIDVTGGHYNSSLRVLLRADENGSGAGQATLQMWVSEPGQTWNWAGFGYNVTNDGGSPGGFSRINTSFGQAYMRFSDSGDLVFYNTNTSGTRVQTAQFAYDGSSTFYGSVFAPAYFESSDKRLKKIVDENYRIDSITSIKPKFYEKNGRLEAGYIAQEVQEIYAHAVQEGTEGYLNLSYGQVHTLKIANLEDSVDEIKKKIKELEEKLNSLY